MSKDLVEHLAGREYWGRGVVGAISPSGLWLASEFITGRSDGSKSRKLRDLDLGDRVKGAETIPLGDGEPDALTVYRTAFGVGDATSYLIATNGAQTEPLQRMALAEASEDNGISGGRLIRKAFREPIMKEYIKDGKTKEMDITSYEPDSHHTARVSVVVSDSGIASHKVFHDDEGPARVESFHDSARTQPGDGILVTTYDGVNRADRMQPGPMWEWIHVGCETAEELTDAVWEALAPPATDSPAYHRFRDPGNDMRVAITTLALDPTTKKLTMDLRDNHDYAR